MEIDTIRAKKSWQTLRPEANLSRQETKVFFFIGNKFHIESISLALYDIARSSLKCNINDAAVHY